MKSLMKLAVVWCVIALATCFVAVSGQKAMAQGVGSLFAGQEAEPAGTDTNIAEIMREAARNGIGVIVIDANGNLLSAGQSQTGQAQDALAEEAMSDLMKAQDSFVSFRAELIYRLQNFPNDINEVLFILRATSPDGRIWTFFEVLYLSLLLFGIGYIVERKIYGERIAKRFVVARSKENPVGYSEKMPWLVFRFFMGVIGILVSMAVAYVIGAIIWGPLDDVAMQFTAWAVNLAYFLSRLVAGLWRMILSPFLPQYRIPMLTTPEARRLHFWLFSLGTLEIFRLLFVVWVRELGLNYDVYAFIGSLSGAIVVLLNIIMVLVNRAPLTRAITSGQPPEKCTFVIRVLAMTWAPLAILYMIYAWVQVTYNLVIATPITIPLLAGAYAILLSIIVVYGVINFVIERSFARARAMREMNARHAAGDDDEAGEEGQEERPEGDMAAPAAAPPVRMNTFEALARRVAGILAMVAGIRAFFYIWEDDTRMVESLASQLLDVIVILFIGYIVYHAFRIWIDQKIADEQGNESEAELGNEGGQSSASRLATLLPLFRNFILILMVVTIGLIVLMELGINVGPLFAGAGVVGVAVGFGSQALVRDIFSGGFFLFDDAFRKGEYLDVGGVKGTVEKISVRSFQLRHHLGALHTIPFGEIQVMTNYSRDWVIMKLPLRVTYDTDVEKVRKLIKKLGIELLDDPVIGENFIQPLKSQGVIEMQDSAMIIRVKFMTKPGDQWLVRKRVYEEIRILFEREGIHFAHKEVTVRLADGKVEDLTPEQRKAVTAAAQASIDEDMMDAQGGGDDDR